MLRRFAPFAMFALVAAGCGGDEGYRFPVHPADGTVVRKGQPVPKAIVRFHPVDPATVKVPDGKEGPAVMLTTETDEAGKFAMSTYLADDGVPEGEYTVTVAAGAPEIDVENADARIRPTPNATDTSESDVEGGDGRPRKKSSRKAATARADVYRDPATSPLKATVKPGENHFDFKLD